TCTNGCLFIQEMIFRSRKAGGGNISFNDTLDAGPGHRCLRSITDGTTTFLGEVGGGNPFVEFTTGEINGTFAGPLIFNADVTTTGLQLYRGDITVGGAVTFTSTGDIPLDPADDTTPQSTDDITLNSTLDGGFAVSINTDGTTTFGNTVGGTEALGSLSTDSGGTVVFNGDVSTTGAQTYNDGATVGSAIIFSSTGGGDIVYNSILDGGFAVNINTTGATIFADAVGGTTALSSLTTDAGGTVAFNGDITTTGVQTYNDAATLTNNAACSSTGNGDITLNSTLDGDFDVNVNTGGATTFGDAVGGTSALSNLGTDIGGSTQLLGNITTTGAQTYADDLIIGAVGTADLLQLTATDVQFGSKITFDITGRNTNDSLSITGGVDLNNATLELLNGGHATPYRGEIYTLIANDGADPILGIFNGLDELATITVGNVEYQISYVGGDGNDVTLTVMSSRFKPTIIMMIL
ncbi:MAG: hypothetical protein D3923_10080, partial [Candidatus Electrothrix sp. AR3]|nr:hypothetical protein [Candidatus Electrothrix sp. AR3]